MSIRTLKIIKGALAFTATLLFLYATRFLWQNYSVTMPLNNELMDIKGVQKVTVEKSSKINEPVNIDIYFNNIANFQKTYAEINKKTVQALKGRAYVISIKDSGSDELEELYSNINLYIEKALIDGSFPNLLEKSNELAAAVGAQSKIFIDEKNIYLQLTKDDSSLYKLIQRQTRGVGGEK